MRARAIRMGEELNSQRAAPPFMPNPATYTLDIKPSEPAQSSMPGPIKLRSIPAPSPIQN